MELPVQRHMQGQGMDLTHTRRAGPSRAAPLSEPCCISLSPPCSCLSTRCACEACSLPHLCARENACCLRTLNSIQAPSSSSITARPGACPRARRTSDACAATECEPGATRLRPLRRQCGLFTAKINSFEVDQQIQTRGSGGRTKSSSWTQG